MFRASDSRLIQPLEARLATHSSSESSLDQLPSLNFDVDFLNSLQPLEGADGIHAGDPQSDSNDLFPPFASSETSSEGVKSGKRRATLSDIGTAAEDTMPIFLPSLGFDIDPNLPQDELYVSQKDKNMAILRLTSAPDRRCTLTPCIDAFQW